MTDKIYLGILFLMLIIVLVGDIKLSQTITKPFNYLKTKLYDKKGNKK